MFSFNMLLSQHTPSSMPSFPMYSHLNVFAHMHAGHSQCAASKLHVHTQPRCAASTCMHTQDASHTINKCAGCVDVQPRHTHTVGHFTMHTRTQNTSCSVDVVSMHTHTQDTSHTIDKHAGHLCSLGMYMHIEHLVLCQSSLATAPSTPRAHS
jgi:hypothetical protein